MFIYSDHQFYLCHFLQCLPLIGFLFVRHFNKCNELYIQLTHYDQKHEKRYKPRTNEGRIGLRMRTAVCSDTIAEKVQFNYTGCPNCRTVTRNCREVKVLARVMRVQPQVADHLLQRHPYFQRQCSIEFIREVQKNPKIGPNIDNSFTVVKYTCCN